ncbi:MerR family transcriptional regulator [Streptomyces sp. NBC_00572]|uniref:helix-turn-helix domain-containing protein n=1 Tax=Streptomyces sp. NBC_00572 TaxID=2903664 RepID=UPI00224D794D|nr:MerR family transcriptional regulator [Streptomyces sp. NBC_00572]MCX4984968.1 MerR family transcriptional regulator [Streptomyces sp. NBC_00572]
MKSSADETSMTIGELADRFALRTHVLRHWEATGLLSPAERVNGRRRYSTRHIARVAMIVRGKAAGFSLEQLRAVLDASDAAERRVLLLEQRAELERRMEEIAASKTLIEHALECKAKDFTECPGFRKLVEQLANGPAATPVETPGLRGHLPG